MFRRLGMTTLVVFFSLAATANADPIPVTYDIGPYENGGYSASWLHTASGCTGDGPDSGETLYMCGNATSISGTISGFLDGGIFSVDGGALNIFGNSFAVISGSLGGAFTDGLGAPLWYLEISGFGTFIFENLDMGDGLPNNFDGNQFWLWGQNGDAYGCGHDSQQSGIDEKQECMPWGIDLYGKRNTVPEPGTLALLFAGLLGMGVARRSRQQVSASH